VADGRRPVADRLDNTSRLRELPAEKVGDFHGSYRMTSLSGSPDSGLYTSTNLCCRKFRDHVNFDACAKWHLRHTDGTARMDAPLAEHLDK